MVKYNVIKTLQIGKLNVIVIIINYQLIFFIKNVIYYITLLSLLILHFYMGS